MTANTFVKTTASRACIMVRLQAIFFVKGLNTSEAATSSAKSSICNGSFKESTNGQAIWSGRLAPTAIVLSRSIQDHHSLFKPFLIGVDIGTSS